jgi:hypothetical protein
LLLLLLQLLLWQCWPMRQLLPPAALLLRLPVLRRAAWLKWGGLLCRRHPWGACLS